MSPANRGSFRFCLKNRVIPLQLLPLTGVTGPAAARHPLALLCCLGVGLTPLPRREPWVPHSLPWKSGLLPSASRALPCFLCLRRQPHSQARRPSWLLPYFELILQAFGFGFGSTHFKAPNSVPVTTAAQEVTSKQPQPVLSCRQGSQGTGGCSTVCGLQPEWCANDGGGLPSRRSGTW